MAVIFKIKNLDSFILNLERKFNKIVNDKKLLTEIGRVSSDRMKFEARRTTPLQGNKRGRFPSGYPTDGSIRIRDRLGRNNATHPAFDPARGNLTITGQLINAIKFEISKGELVFFIDGKRRAYKNPNGEKIPTKDNSEVYKDLVVRNRNFSVLGVDAQLRKRIKQIIIRSFRRVR